jgi:hypothetical protein
MSRLLLEAATALAVLLLATGLGAFAAIAVVFIFGRPNRHE